MKAGGEENSRPNVLAEVEQVEEVMEREVVGEEVVRWQTVVEADEATTPLDVVCNRTAGSPPKVYFSKKILYFSSSGEQPRAGAAQEVYLRAENCSPGLRTAAQGWKMQPRAGEAEEVYLSAGCAGSPVPHKVGGMCR